MLKDLLKTLKDVRFGIYTEPLIKEGFDYLISRSHIFTMYSIKIEIERAKFSEYLRDTIDVMPIFEFDDEFLDKTVEISNRWYSHLLDHKTLFGSNSSLKSELKKLYKKRVGSIEGFDRFYESIFNAIQEASNIFTIVFYEPDALLLNDKFPQDRKSCYIDSRPDYLTAIRQYKAYYVMIYKNQTPLTRVWFVANETFDDAVIFNQYGIKLKSLAQFFSDPSENELFKGDYKKLGNVIGIYVNEDTVLTTTNDYDKFTYKLSCPSCGAYIYSNELTLLYDDEEDMYRLKCYHCADLVYSDKYNRYIHEEEAVYSDYYETFIYESEAVYSEYLGSYLLKDDAVYSEYLDDYIPYDGAVKALDDDAGDWTWIPEEMAVYSTHEEGIYLIKEQAVYSEYYGSYIFEKDAIYSDEIESYIYPMDLQDAIEEMTGSLED